AGHGESSGGSVPVRRMSGAGIDRPRELPRIQGRAPPFPAVPQERRNMAAPIARPGTSPCLRIIEPWKPAMQPAPDTPPALSSHATRGCGIGEVATHGDKYPEQHADGGAGHLARLRAWPGQPDQEASGALDEELEDDREQTAPDQAQNRTQRLAGGSTDWPGYRVT